MLNAQVDIHKEPLYIAWCDNRSILKGGLCWMGEKVSTLVPPASWSRHAGASRRVAALVLAPREGAARQYRRAGAGTEREAGD
jgi:hypothetical protein